MRIGPFMVSADSLTLIGILILLVYSTMLMIIPAIKKQNDVLRKYRLIAIIIVILAFSLIALRPKWYVVVRNSDAMLLTPGTTMTQLRSIPDSLRRPDYVFSLIGEEPWDTVYPRIIQIPDAAYIARHYPEVGRLDVIGHGLSDYDWKAIEHVAIRHFQSPLRPGISQIHWKQELPFGETFEIRGTVTPETKPKLYLKGPGGTADSCKITGEFTFELHTMPKESGKYIYHITDNLSENDAFIMEKIAIRVLETDTPRILILRKSPTFEINYLKNWLGDIGYQVMVRTKISKNRYRNEFLNIGTRNIARITKDLLDSLDLVISDSDAVESLDRQDISLLRSGIENGLGLFIFFIHDKLEDQDSRVSKLKRLRDFSFRRFRNIDLRSVRPALVGQADSLAKISTHPLEIMPTFGLRPIVTDELERILAGTLNLGTGLLGTSLLKDTYHWLLEDNSYSFYAYWTHIISILSRKTDNQDLWALPAPQSISVDRPLQIRLLTKSWRPIGQIVDGSGQTSRIYFKQGVYQSDQWSGVYWPRGGGWHRISAPGGNASWFYVYQKNDWTTWHEFDKEKETLHYSVHAADYEKPKDIFTRIPRDIPLFWFFATFILGIAFLWIEKKI